MLKSLALLKSLRILATGEPFVKGFQGRRVNFWIVLLLIVAAQQAGLSAVAEAAVRRFHIQGDGTLRIQVGKERDARALRFRNDLGEYNAAVLTEVNRLWGIRRGEMDVDLRLLEVLDNLQERDPVADRPFVIASGYRPRRYNNDLRKKKRMAAQSSMHIEAGAVDLFFPGVSSAQVAAAARALNCCGVGYYHGKTAHIDTGPVRFWDEQTSGTEKTAPQRNAKIIASTPFDIYREGELVQVRLQRITELPVSVSSSARIVCGREGESQRTVSVELIYPKTVRREGGCYVLTDYSMVRLGRWQTPRLPRKCRKGRPVRFHLQFCAQVAPEMPATVWTNAFQFES
jgi:uncharacterized protein YcbK (DUF882 family)